MQLLCSLLNTLCNPCYLRGRKCTCIHGWDKSKTQLSALKQCLFHLHAYPADG